MKTMFGFSAATVVVAAIPQQIAIPNPMHVHDLNATLLHCLAIDHEKLTYRFQGRDFRLTDVHGNVVKEILA